MSFLRAHQLIYQEPNNITEPTFFNEMVPWLHAHPHTVEGENMTAVQERAWGCYLQGINSPQWTTKLGEFCVAFTLFHTLKDQNIIYRPKYRLDINGLEQNYIPDFSTDEFFVEVKTRNWCTPGTIGQKNFGSFYHYLPLVAETGKPIIITFLAYAEKEMGIGLRISGHQHRAQYKVLKYLEKLGIYFVPYTELEQFIRNKFLNEPSEDSDSGESAVEESVDSDSDDDSFLPLPVPLPLNHLPHLPDLAQNNATYDSDEDSDSGDNESASITCSLF